MAVQWREKAEDKQKIKMMKVTTVKLLFNPEVIEVKHSILYHVIFQPDQFFPSWPHNDLHWQDFRERYAAGNMWLEILDRGNAHCALSFLKLDYVTWINLYITHYCPFPQLRDECGISHIKLLAAKQMEWSHSPPSLAPRDAFSSLEMV